MSSRIVTAFAVYGFFVLGLFLLIAPWTPIWERAAMGLDPSGGGWAMSGWVKGVVSGLGALDLYVASQMAGELWSRLGGPGGGLEG